MIDPSVIGFLRNVLLVKRAMGSITAVYAREFSVEEKEDKSPLTEADQAAHHVIMRGLAKSSNAVANTL